MLIISGQAGSPQIYLANQRSTNNEYNHYTQSNLLIDNVPLSTHINNYLIKLIIPLNKTGQPPDPANFSNDSYLLLGSVLIGSSSSSGIPAALLSCSFFALACSLIRDIINNVFFLYNRGKCNKKRIIDGNSRELRLNSSMGFAQCVKDFNVVRERERFWTRQNSWEWCKCTMWLIQEISVEPYWSIW